MGEKKPERPKKQRKKTREREKRSQRRTRETNNDEIKTRKTKIKTTNKYCCRGIIFITKCTLTNDRIQVKRIIKKK